MSSEILKKHPDAKTEIVAVWFRNLWSDARFLWPSDALDDPRAVNFWDHDQVVGKWYADNLTHRRNGAEWDTWILYAPGEKFLDPPEAWGHTIVGTHERLRTSLDKLERESKGRSFGYRLHAEGLQKADLLSMFSPSF